jgi:MATE family, multidrug efflux pump
MPVFRPQPAADTVFLNIYTAEFIRLFRLALPLVLTQLAQMGFSLADTIMAGRVSSVELAGVALGTVVFWPLMFLVSGVVMAITPTVSQLRGAGRLEAGGETVRQAMWIALVGGIVLVFVFRNLDPIYHLIGVDPEALPVTRAYLLAMSWGVIPALFYYCLRYLCEGSGWTMPALLITASALLLKLPLNYWFIYGGYGVPALGGEGCGWATVIALLYQLLVMALVVRFSRLHQAGFYARFSWPDFDTIRRLVVLGVPIGLAIFLEFSLFSSLTLMIGRLGVEAIAAHQIASNVGALAFMVPYALGMAASIRVGTNVGAEDLDGARVSGWVALGTSLLFALVAAVILVFGRDLIASWYSTEAAVVALAAQLMIFVAIYQPFDDVQATAMGVLRGFKDTRRPFLITVLSYWFIAFPISWTLGFGYFESLDYGVYGYWVGLIVGLAIAAAALLGRFVYLINRPERVKALAAA